MYENIAAFYDKNIGAVNYDLMSDFLYKVFNEYCKTNNTDERPILLDAACGTGECALRLSRKGCDMIGLDISESMLQEASEKEGADAVTWICQDMTEMDLFGTVQAVFCMTDSVNHLLWEEDLEAFLSGASLFTEKGGLLVFDCLTDSYYRQIIDGNTFVQDEDDFCYIWDGIYEDGICDYDITLFEKLPEGTYIKHKDSVTEKMWTEGELKEALHKSGYRIIERYSDMNFTPISRKDERRYYVCRKK